MFHRFETFSNDYRIVEKQQEEKDLLEGCSNGIDYIAKRLDWDQHALKRALKSCPSLTKINVPKVRFLNSQFACNCALKPPIFSDKKSTGFSLD